MARWMVSGRRGFRRHQAVQLRIHQPLLPGEVFAQVHAFSDFSGRNGSAAILPSLRMQHFDARFGLFQLLAAGIAEAHAALEELERALQRQVAAFQFLDHLFELVERGFEGLDRAVAPVGFSAIASF